MNKPGWRGEDTQGYKYMDIEEGAEASANTTAIPPTISGGQQIAQPLHLVTGSAIVFAGRNASLATRVSPSSTNHEGYAGQQQPWEQTDD